MEATVGGGRENTAAGSVATVSGGGANRAGGAFAAIGGGYGSRADGLSATVPGGSGNTAQGDYSFAAGRQAKAKHDGAFVWADWADSAGAPFESTAANQFLVRAGGGVGINTNGPAADTLTVGGDGLKVAANGTAFKRVQAGTATVGSGAGGVKTVTVTFPTAFTATPAVLVTARSGNYNDTFVVTTRSISPAQFQVNVYRVDIAGGGWAQSLQLDWLAWE